MNAGDTEGGFKITRLSPTKVMIGRRLIIDHEIYEVDGKKLSCIDAVYDSPAKDVIGGALLENDIPAMSHEEFLQYVERIVEQKPEAIRHFVGELLLAEFGYGLDRHSDTISKEFKLVRCCRATRGNQTYYAFDGVETAPLGPAKFSNLPAWTLVMNELRTCLGDATMDSISMERAALGSSDYSIRPPGTNAEPSPSRIVIKSHGQEMTLEHQGVNILSPHGTSYAKELLVAGPGMSWFIGWLDGAIESALIVTRMVEIDELELWLAPA